MPDPRSSDAASPAARIWAMFLLLSIIWGSSFFFIEIALADGLGPLTIATLRTVLGLALLGVVFVAQRGAMPVDLDAWRRFTILALTNLAVPFVLIIWGQQSITSGMAGILNALVPLFALVLAAMAFADEQLTSFRVGSVVVGFIGVALLATPSLGAIDQADGLATLAGMAAMLLASLLYAVGVVYARQQLSDAPIMRAADGGRRRATVLELTFWQVLIAAIVLIVAMLVVERPVRGLVSFPGTADGWLAMLWLGVLGTGLAYILFFRVVNAWGATRASLITYVIPPIAIVLGVVFLDERFAPVELLGTALIIGGIVLVNAGAGRQSLATGSRSA